MDELTTRDLRLVSSRVPVDISYMMNESLLFIAGGFIRDTIAGSLVQDIDIFGESKDAQREAASRLAHVRAGRLHDTDNAYTVLAPLWSPVQFITRWCFGDPVSLVKSFDFTVAQAVIWRERGSGDWKSLCSSEFYKDLAARRLVYTFPVRDEEAGGSMMRVCKFLKRGWSIQTASLGGVISRLVGKVDMHKAGDEVGVAKIITSLLVEVDPNSLIDGLEPVPVDGV